MTVVARSDSPDLDSLARGIDLAAGVAFYFLIVNDPRQREQAVADLERQLKHRHVRKLRITHNDQSLLDLLRQIRPLRADELLVVMGLESVFDEGPGSPFVRNLNATRDAFPRILTNPILFVISSHALAVLLRGAPDFMSARSGTYFYARRRAEIRPERFHQPPGLDLSDVQRRQRIAETEDLLNEFRNGKGADTELQLRRARRLINLLVSRYDSDRAEALAAEALRIATPNYPQEMLNLLSILAEINRVRGDANAAAYYAELTGNIARRLGDVASNLRALWVAADAAWQRPDEAERLYKEALGLAQTIGDSRTAAQIEMSLGNALLRRGDPASALDWIEKAHQDANDVADRPLVAEIQSMAAAALVSLGRLQEAERAIRQSLDEFARLGDRMQLSMSYVELGDIYFAQNRLEEAENAYQQSLALVRETSILPTRGIPPLLRLVDIKMRQNDRAAAEALAREALLLIEQNRKQLPESAEVERNLRDLFE